MELSIVTWLNASFKIPSIVSDIRTCFRGQEICSVLSEVWGINVNPIGDAANAGPSMALVRRTWWQSVVRIVASIMAKQNPNNGNEQQLFAKIDQDVNTEALARESAIPSLVAFFELLLFCVVQSAAKQTYVYRLMQLQTDHQKRMMDAIQRIAVKYPISSNTPPSNDQSSSGTSAAPRRLSVTEYQTRIESLKSERDQLTIERDNLKREKDSLITSASQMEQHCAQLQRSLKTAEQQLTEEKSRVQTLAASQFSSPVGFNSKRSLAIENEQLKANIAAREKTFAELKRQNESLSNYVSKTKELQDTVEVMREKVSAAEKIEEKLRGYERKLQEMNQLKQQLTTLTTENSALHSAKRDLEEAKRQVTLLQANLDKYKQRSVELSARTGELELHIQMKQNEIGSLKAQLEEITLTSKQQESIIRSLEMHRASESEIPVLRVARAKPRGETLASLLASSASNPSSGVPVASGGASSEELQATLEKVLGLEDELETSKLLQQRLQQEKMNLTMASNELSSDRDQLSAKLQQAQHMLNGTTAELERTQAMMKQHASEHEHIIAQLREQLSFSEHALASERQQTENLRKELARVQTQIASAEAQYQHQQSQLHASNMEIDRLRTELRTTTTNYEERIAAVSAQLEQHQRKIQMQEAEHKIVVSSFYNMATDLYKAQLAPALALPTHQPQQAEPVQAQATAPIVLAPVAQAKPSLPLAPRAAPVVAPQPMKALSAATQALMKAKVAPSSSRTALGQIDLNFAGFGTGDLDAPIPSPNKKRRLTLAERALERRGGVAADESHKRTKRAD